MNFFLGCLTWAVVFAGVAHLSFPNATISFMVMTLIAFVYFILGGWFYVCRFAPEPLSEVPAKRFFFYPLPGLVVGVVIILIRTLNILAERALTG